MEEQGRADEEKNRVKPRLRSVAIATTAGGAVGLTAVKIKPTVSRSRSKAVISPPVLQDSSLSGNVDKAKACGVNADIAVPHRSYRHSLRATLDGHQALLKRMDKTQNTIDQTSRTKRLAAMMEHSADKTNNFVIQPSSRFRFVWDVCTSAAVLYYCLAIPLRIMARYQCSGNTMSAYSAHNSTACLSQWDWSLMIDYILDALLVADFVLRSRYFAFQRYEGEREVVECDRDLIWMRFQGTTRFYLLLLLMVPVDMLSLYSGFILCLRMFKLPSLLLLTEVIQDMQQWLDHERGVSVSSEAVTVLHLAFYAVLVISWMSVGWCLLHYEGAKNYKWISAIYWCLTTATTTGYGDIAPTNTPQTVYNVFMSIIGPTIFATIIAKVASYVKK